MPRVGFEPTISAGERPKTYALDRAATGTGILSITSIIIEFQKKKPTIATIYIYLNENFVHVLIIVLEIQQQCTESATCYSLMPNGRNKFTILRT